MRIFSTVGIINYEDIARFITLSIFYFSMKFAKQRFLLCLLNKLNLFTNIIIFK